MTSSVQGLEGHEGDAQRRSNGSVPRSRRSARACNFVLRALVLAACERGLKHKISDCLHSYCVNLCNTWGMQA